MSLKPTAWTCSRAGFVDILAAEQTPDNPHWFQGTADAVRQAVRHFARHDAEYYLILAGDHLYRMDYAAMIEEHVERRADITIAAQPVTPEDAPGMGIFRFDADGQIVGFEEKPKLDRLNAIGSSVPAGARFMRPSGDKPFVASMGIYVFTRDALLESLEQHEGVDFGHEIIPAALGSRRVNAHLFRDYWQDVGTVASFYDANIMLTKPGRRSTSTTRAARCSRGRGSFRVPGSTTAPSTKRSSRRGPTRTTPPSRSRLSASARGSDAAARIGRSVLLGADFYENDDDAPAFAAEGPPMGIGAGSVLDRVIVDKNARIGPDVRLTNEAGVQDADGDGYHIRGGIIIVPKWGIVPRPARWSDPKHGINLGGNGPATGAALSFGDGTRSSRPTPARPVRPDPACGRVERR